MRIGLNLLYLIPDTVGGTETYARGLLYGLRNVESKYEFIVFLNQEASAMFKTEIFPFDTVVCPVNAVHRHERYFYEQFVLPKLAKRSGVSLMHSLGYTTPLRLHCPSVVTVHDLNYRAFGDQMPLTRRLALEFFVGMGIRFAQKIITVSDFSKHEIIRAYAIDERRVAVTHEAPLVHYSQDEAIAEGEVKDTNSTVMPAPYFVAFSSSSPHKNISRLIEAYASLRRSKSIKHSLVLIGHTPRDLSIEAEVYSTGYLTRGKMLKVLRGADFLVFPSYYEGFGLPILEGMACGVPVACSRAASLPEVAGDAAIYFDPFSKEDIAEAIEQLSRDSDLRSALKKKGYCNVQRFSWDETAKKTLAVYDEILESLGD